MNVWYCNHYAMPPGAGGAERPVRLAEALLEAGEAVLVVSASRHHLYRQAPEAAADPGVLDFRETQGVSFCLVGSRGYQGNGVGRLLNMRDYSRGLSMLATEVKSGRLPSPDLIVYSSPHPFGIPAALRLARKTAARLALEVRDLWPQSMIEVAGLSPLHPVCLWGRYCVRIGYRKAEAVIGVLPGMAEAGKIEGLDAERVVTITNGVSLEKMVRQVDRAERRNPYREEFQRARERNRLVVAYTGSLGVANDLDQILDLNDVAGDDNEGGRALVGGRPYHFFLIGDGVCASKLKQRIREQGIDFVSVLPPVEKDHVPAVLADADAAVVVWKKLDLYLYGVSPNKLFDYFASGLPVFWVGDTLPDPVREADAGWSLMPNDSAALHAALVAAASTDRESLRTMGERGREYVKKSHDWVKLGQLFVEFCRCLVEGRFPASLR